MDAQLILDLFGDLPQAQIRELLELAEPPGRRTTLKPGLWRGRNGGMPWPLKRFVQKVVRRDWFCKLVFEGWGVNVRVSQDGEHRLLPSEQIPGGVRVDLPFRVEAGALDYGLHLFGLEPPGALSMRDLLWTLPFETLIDAVSLRQLQRVGLARADAEEGEGTLIIGTIAPLGLRLLQGSPFGMVWWRDAREPERRSAQLYLERRRVLDSAR